MDEEAIKQVIKDYIKIDDEIIEINKQTKDIRNRKKILEEGIKDYMISNGKSVVLLAGAGSLKLSKSKPANKKLNKDEILSVLIESLEELQVNKVIEDLFDKDTTPPEEKTKLERTKAKK